MRIVHIVAHPVLNGVATSTLTLINAQLQRGHDILLITMDNAWLSKQAFIKPIDILHSHLKTKLKEIGRVWKTIEQWNPHAIHCHGSKANKYGMAYRVFYGSPVIATAHARIVQIPWLFFRAVIAPSKQTAEFYRHKNRVSEKRVHTIPNLFPTNVTDVMERQKARDIFGLTPTDFVIGMIGGIGPRKNQVLALKLLKQLLLEVPNARLLLIGEHHEIKDIKDWAHVFSDNDVKKATILAGQRDNAAALIPAFDVLLSTSTREEGSITLLEGMAQKIPTISSATGSVIDLIRHGVDGFVFELDKPEDALQALVSLAKDPKLKEKIGENGKARIEIELKQNTLLDQLDAVYKKAAKASGIYV